MIHADESRIEPNVNCLAGKRCPECGSLGPFELVVSMRVLLYDTGTHNADDSSIEFDDGAPARCNSCGHQGKFGDFNG